MRNFIFYTSDGFTEDTERQEVDNCQVLGFGKGFNLNAAFLDFKNENSWLQDYNFEEVIAQEIIGEAQHLELNHVYSK